MPTPVRLAQALRQGRSGDGLPQGLLHPQRWGGEGQPGGKAADLTQQRPSAAGHQTGIDDRTRFVEIPTAPFNRRALELGRKLAKIDNEIAAAESAWLEAEEALGR